MNDLPLVFYHAPQSRSGVVRILFEELQAPHELVALDLKSGEQRRPDYLAINPMGKVPAIRHGEALITEQVAIFIYLADLFPEAGLAPAIGDPLRGPYLRWLAFYGSCFEPAMIDRSQKRAPAPSASSPYGDFDTMQATLVHQLESGPYILGERITAADILWGRALQLMMTFKLLPEIPVIADYVGRIGSRPAAIAAGAADAALAAAQDARR